MLTRATPKPGQVKPPITEDTALLLNYNINTLLTKIALTQDEETYFVRLLDAANISLEFDRTMKQFTVYNASPASIYISIFDVSNLHYMFNVATLKYFISPAFLFLGLKIFQTPYDPAVPALPTLTAHNKTLLAPGCYVIP